jgi:hypothetical protein
MNLRTDEDKQSADLSRREFVTKVARATDMSPVGTKRPVEGW